MRRVTRVALPTSAQRYLNRRQVHADRLRSKRQLDVDKHWKASRQTRSVGQVLAALQAMAGPRQRCMYCLDSHGSDIDHFRPKACWPQRMYDWSNLVLCCTFCGRLKGSQFPMKGRRALLLDPSQENPWEHLDFDPVTGNICARFDLARNDWSAKGMATVKVLQLDRREALSRGYLKTLQRLCAVVEAALGLPEVDAGQLASQLRAEDDHGLLGWCFSPQGSKHASFAQLLANHPVAWRRCRRALSI